MNGKWMAVWGSASSYTAPTPGRYAKNVTLRYTLRAQLGGSKIRLHLNNLYGKEEAVLTRLFVGAPGRAFVPVTFGGETACHLAPGGRVVSDEIDFALTRGEDYTVTFYLGEVTPLHSGTNSNGPLCRYRWAEGDYATEEEFPAVHSMGMDTVFFLDTVDVFTADEQARTLVCFGDSITAQSWPDYLVLRAFRENREHLSIIRRAIGGSRVLRQYEHLQFRHYGSKGLSRFEREISADGVDRVIILHGVNDIIHPCGVGCRPWSDLPTAEELIDGLRWYVNTAHALGKKVYLCTILPIEGWNSYLPQREDIRQAVNAWIRTQQEADGVIDMAAATQDPANPLHLLPLCDSGDHLHPSLAGAEIMAEYVPAAILD